jgi:hypothetical protein
MKPRALLHALILLALNGASAAFSATTAPQRLTMTFSHGAIVITGSVKSQPIYLFGVVREARGYINRIQPYEARLVDDAGMGSVSYPFDAVRSQRSVWVAVDLVSGAAVSGHPNEYAVTEMLATEGRIKKNAAGELAQMSAHGSLCNFLVVRPGTGVWNEMVASRGPLDDGNEDGKTTVSVEKLAPHGETNGPPPHALKKGDVVFVVDSFGASYTLLTIGD